MHAFYARLVSTALRQMLQPAHRVQQVPIAWQALLRSQGPQPYQDVSRSVLLGTLVLVRVACSARQVSLALLVLLHALRLVLLVLRR